MIEEYKNFIISNAYGHGGGLDSSGGHNCYVGSCKGTYHSHRDSYSKSSNSTVGSFFGTITFLLFIGIIYFVLQTILKEKLYNGGAFYKSLFYVFNLVLTLFFLGLILYYFN